MCHTLHLRLTVFSIRGTKKTLPLNVSLDGMLPESLTEFPSVFLRVTILAILKDFQRLEHKAHHFDS